MNQVWCGLERSKNRLYRSSWWWFLTGDMMKDSWIESIFTPNVQTNLTGLASPCRTFYVWRFATSYWTTQNSRWHQMTMGTICPSNWKIGTISAAQSRFGRLKTLRQHSDTRCIQWWVPIFAIQRGINANMWEVVCGSNWKLHAIAISWVVGCSSYVGFYGLAKCCKSWK